MPNKKEQLEIRGKTLQYLNILKIKNQCYFQRINQSWLEKASPDESFNMSPFFHFRLFFLSLFVSKREASEQPLVNTPSQKRKHFDSVFIKIWWSSIPLNNGRIVTKDRLRNAAVMNDKWKQPDVYGVNAKLELSYIEMQWSKNTISQNSLNTCLRLAFSLFGFLFREWSSAYLDKLTLLRKRSCLYCDIRRSQKFCGKNEE